MTMIDTSHYKTVLEDLLAEVTVELTDLGVLQPNGDWVTTPEDMETQEADPNIAADRSEEWVERRGTLAALETRYNNIKRALAKIEAGTYGTCEVCGEVIETDRLDANPAARTCKAHLNEEESLLL